MHINSRLNEWEVRLYTIIPSLLNGDGEDVDYIDYPN